MANFFEPVTDVNRSTSQAPLDYLHYLKETLKSAGWTVVQSSDGNAVSSGDVLTSTAAWQNYSDPWYRITDPAGLREITVQKSLTNPLSALCRMKYSPAAKFTTGAAAKQTPSATDEVIFFGAGTDASPTYGLHTLHTGGRVHFWAATVPVSGVYPFWGGHTLGTGKIAGITMMDGMLPDSYQEEDSDPCIVFHDGTQSSGTTPSSDPSGNLSQGVAQYGIQGWVDYGGGSAAVAEMFWDPITDVTQSLESSRRGGCRVRYKSANYHKGWGAITTQAFQASATDAYPDTINLASDEPYVVFNDLWLPWETGTVPL